MRAGHGRIEMGGGCKQKERKGEREKFLILEEIVVEKINNSKRFYWGF